jgi:TPR repeat protein
LGVCYAFGDGVAKDQVEAVKWFRKAAEQNYAPAQFKLGLSYTNRDGVADQVEAVKWLRKAAEQNYAEAQFNLSVCYDNGEGVAEDYVEAYKWRRLAATQGDEDAKKAMTALENKMTPEQIAEGQKLAGNFKPR